MESKVRIDPTDQLKPPMPPINKMMFPSESSAPSSAVFTPPAPASGPSSPQLNKPPASFNEQFSTEVGKGMARLTKDIAKLSGDLHAIRVHLGIPSPSEEPSTGPFQF
ncbi:hypothetical protein Pyn_32453 [Prunus yedoensis var. nudiflora]|uniref:Uncharacterized protein n=1 Tax=Prunus yedoensis var. nudiflora TaxID=2094558 RepID=A0A314ZLI9_PRUYE|nr:hypothetical protein Pyn_32453 [Prunus yedoensis var. nudiflora]